MARQLAEIGDLIAPFYAAAQRAVSHRRDGVPSAWDAYYLFGKSNKQRQEERDRASREKLGKAAGQPPQTHHAPPGDRKDVMRIISRADDLERYGVPGDVATLMAYQEAGKPVKGHEREKLDTYIRDHPKQWARIQEGLVASRVETVFQDSDEVFGLSKAEYEQYLQDGDDPAEWPSNKS